MHNIKRTLVVADLLEGENKEVSWSTSCWLVPDKVIAGVGTEYTITPMPENVQKQWRCFQHQHQHWKIFNNNRDSRSSQLPENLQKQWWIYSQMSVTNAVKSAQNNKSWGEKIFSWNLRRRGHFAESKLEVGSWKPHVGAVRTRFLAYYPRFAPTWAALL